MRNLHRNLFLLFGICAVGIMLWQFPEGWERIQQNPHNVALYLPAAIGIWTLVYALNAWAFQLLVNTSDHDKHLPYLKAFKLTLSGYAFSYTTPFGSGGTPYRVMELSRFIGMPRAISSVSLYAMMHVFSHFFLWTTALLVFVVSYFERITPTLFTFFALYLLIFMGAIVFFRHCYQHGIIAQLFRTLFHFPLIRHWARPFYARHQEHFHTIDANFRFLYQHPRQLWGSLLLEYFGRVVNALEFYFILLAFGLTQASFADALILLAFSSLVGNLLFFFPMQMGAREGSLGIIVPFLFSTVSSTIGIYVSFFTRIREIFWIILGLLLVKIGNRQLMK